MKKTGVCLLLAGMCLGTVSFAEGPEGDMGGDRPGSAGWEERHEKRVEEVEQKLGLTPEQAQKLKEHRRSHREQAKVLREEAKASREALKAALEAPALDETKVRALHQNIKDVQGRLADHRLAGVLEARKILSPEQFKKLHELMEEKKEGRGKGPRGPRGEGREKGGRKGPK